jgi:uncharacterized protein (DUF2235 family)
MTVRNLFVGCDGTWNEPESSTNVKRFLDAVRQTDRQVVHYEKGVGTRAFEALPGGIYGYGLEKRVLGSYRFLRKCFAQRAWSREQNRIFLLGFSRGAYTVRRISGLLAHSGLPKKAEDVELGWEVFKQRDTRGAATLKREGRFYDVPVEMVGVWDTVKGTNDPDYNDSKMASNVTAGYHAMATDERRKFFPVLKWSQDPRALQVWFPGVHSDVGGGYKESGLSNGALRWMIFRALGHGVAFRQDKVTAIKASPLGKIHESLQGVWTALGERQRRIPRTSWIHPSVGTRRKQRTTYRPTNLPAPPRYWAPTAS